MDEHNNTIKLLLNVWSIQSSIMKMITNLKAEEKRQGTDTERRGACIP